METAYLVLENGEIFPGRGFGAAVEARGELVVNTGVANYCDALSDSRYYGQIALFTFPQIGNYGIISGDMEGGVCRAAGVVVREWCQLPSNHRSEGTIDEYLKAQGVPGICGVDTRSIAQIIREQGHMAAAICCGEPESLLSSLRGYKAAGYPSLCREMTTRLYEPEAGNAINLVVVDFGTKQKALDELLRLGCRCTVVPFDTAAEDMLSLSPEGVVLTTGPGDPVEYEFAIEQVRKLAGRVPLMGIGLGHQLLALARGGGIMRLRQGHRGASHPVRELSTGRIYITTQNHGYAVDADRLPQGAETAYMHINDHTVEGLRYTSIAAFSLQFYPHDGAMEQRFESFLQLIKESK